MNPASFTFTSIFDYSRSFITVLSIFLTFFILSSLAVSIVSLPCCTNDAAAAACFLEVCASDDDLLLLRGCNASSSTLFISFGANSTRLTIDNSSFLGVAINMSSALSTSVVLGAHFVLSSSTIGTLRIQGGPMLASAWINSTFRIVNGSRLLGAIMLSSTHLVNVSLLVGGENTLITSQTAAIVLDGVEVAARSTIRIIGANVSSRSTSVNGAAIVWVRGGSTLGSASRIDIEPSAVICRSETGIAAIVAVDESSVVSDGSSVSVALTKLAATTTAIVESTVGGSAALVWISNASLMNAHFSITAEVTVGVRITALRGDAALFIVRLDSRLTSSTFTFDSVAALTVSSPRSSNYWLVDGTASANGVLWQRIALLNVTVALKGIPQLLIRSEGTVRAALLSIPERSSIQQLRFAVDSSIIDVVANSTGASAFGLRLRDCVVFHSVALLFANSTKLSITSGLSVDVVSIVTDSMADVSVSVMNSTQVHGKSYGGQCLFYATFQPANLVRQDRTTLTVATSSAVALDAFVGTSICAFASLFTTTIVSRLSVDVVDGSNLVVRHHRSGLAYFMGSSPGGHVADTTVRVGRNASIAVLASLSGAYGLSFAGNLSNTWILFERGSTLDVTSSQSNALVFDAIRVPPISNVTLSFVDSTVRIESEGGVGSAASIFLCTGTTVKQFSLLVTKSYSTSTGTVVSRVLSLASDCITTDFTAKIDQSNISLIAPACQGFVMNGNTATQNYHRNAVIMISHSAVLARQPDEATYPSFMYFISLIQVASMEVQIVNVSASLLEHSGGYFLYIQGASNGSVVLQGGSFAYESTSYGAVAFVAFSSVTNWSLALRDAIVSLSTVAEYDYGGSQLVSHTGTSSSLRLDLARITARFEAYVVNVLSFSSNHVLHFSLRVSNCTFNASSTGYEMALLSLNDNVMNNTEINLTRIDFVGSQLPGFSHGVISIKTSLVSNLILRVEESTFTTAMVPHLIYFCCRSLFEPCAALDTSLTVSDSTISMSRFDLSHLTGVAIKDPLRLERVSIAFLDSKVHLIGHSVVNFVSSRLSNNVNCTLAFHDCEIALNAGISAEVFDISTQFADGEIDVQNLTINASATTLDARFLDLEDLDFGQTTKVTVVNVTGSLVAYSGEAYFVNFFSGKQPENAVVSLVNIAVKIDSRLLGAGFAKMWYHHAQGRISIGNVSAQITGMQRSSFALVISPTGSAHLGIRDVDATLNSFGDPSPFVELEGVATEMWTPITVDVHRVALALRHNVSAADGSSPHLAPLLIEMKNCASSVISMVDISVTSGASSLATVSLVATTSVYDSRLTLTNVSCHIAVAAEISLVHVAADFLNSTLAAEGIRAFATGGFLSSARAVHLNSSAFFNESSVIELKSSTIEVTTRRSTTADVSAIHVASGAFVGPLCDVSLVGVNVTVDGKSGNVSFFALSVGRVLGSGRVSVRSCSISASNRRQCGALIANGDHHNLASNATSATTMIATEVDGSTFQCHNTSIVRWIDAGFSPLQLLPPPSLNTAIKRCSFIVFGDTTELAVLNVAGGGVLGSRSNISLHESRFVVEAAGSSVVIIASTVAPLSVLLDRTHFVNFRSPTTVQTQPSAAALIDQLLINCSTFNGRRLAPLYFTGALGAVPRGWPNTIEHQALVECPSSATESESASRSLPPTASRSVSASQFCVVSFTISASPASLSMFEFREVHRGMLDVTVTLQQDADVPPEHRLELSDSATWNSFELAEVQRSINISWGVISRVETRPREGIVRLRILPDTSMSKLSDLPVFSLTVSTIQLPLRFTPLFTCRDALRRDRSDDNETARHAFAITFRASDPPVPLPVRRTVEYVAMGSTLISSALTNPTTAMVSARSSALMTLSMCQFSHTEPLSATDSPFGWTIGHKSGGYYRGALVGSAFLLIVCTAFGLAVSLLFYDPRRVDRDVWGAMGQVHLPGIILVPISQFFQSTAMVAVALLGHGTGPYDVGLGVGSLVILSLIVAFVIWRTTIAFHAVVVAREEAEDPGNTVLQRALFYMFLSPQKWIDDPAKPAEVSRGFKTHYLSVFASYRSGRQWFLGIELTISVVVGVLNGLMVESLCDEIALIFLILIAVQWLMAVFLRPFLALFETVCHIVLSTLTLVSSLLLVGGEWRQNDKALDAAAYVAAMGVILSTLKSVLDGICLFRWFHSQFKHHRVQLRVARKLRKIGAITTSFAASASKQVSVGSNEPENGLLNAALAAADAVRHIWRRFKAWRATVACCCRESPRVTASTGDFDDAGDDDGSDDSDDSDEGVELDEGLLNAASELTELESRLLVGASPSAPHNAAVTTATATATATIGDAARLRAALVAPPLIHADPDCNDNHLHHLHHDAMTEAQLRQVEGLRIVAEHIVTRSVRLAAESRMRNKCVQQNSSSDDAERLRRLKRLVDDICAGAGRRSDVSEVLQL